jgi:hypothetical protein
MQMTYLKIELVSLFLLTMSDGGPVPRAQNRSRSDLGQPSHQPSALFVPPIVEVQPKRCMPQHFLVDANTAKHIHINVNSFTGNKMQSRS